MQTDVLISPPRTIMEVFKMLPEGTRVELINETLYMSPAPKTNHQKIIFKIARLLADFIEKKIGGEVYLAPCNVYLDETSNAVQPDVFYISEENKTIIHPDGIHGSPDFIIEVLSLSNSKYDLETKKELYERFKVQEYWIVDPAESTAKGFTLSKGKYKTIKSSKGKIASSLFNHVFAFV